MIEKVSLDFDITGTEKVKRGILSVTEVLNKSLEITREESVYAKLALQERKNAKDDEKSNLLKTKALRESLLRQSQDMDLEEKLLAKEQKARAKEESNRQKESNKQIKKQQSLIKDLRGNLLGFGLSIMFLGMQIQRTFTNIAKTSITTFLKMTDNSNPAAIAITRLAGAWDFLKYSIGNALGTALLPLLPTLVNIIAKISDWINKNPKFTAGIVAGGIALGSLLFVLGQILTPMSSILGIMKMFGVSMKFTAITELGTALGWSGILGTVALLIAAMAALAVAWETNLGDIQGYTKSLGKVWSNTFNQMGEDTKGLFSNISKAFSSLIQGDLNKTLDYMVLIVGKFNLAALDLVVAISTIMLNATIFAINAVSDMVKKNVKFMLDGAAIVAEAWGFGWISDQINSVSDKFEKFMNKVKVDYLTTEDVISQVPLFDSIRKTTQADIDAAEKRIKDLETAVKTSSLADYLNIKNPFETGSFASNINLDTSSAKDKINSTNVVFNGNVVIQSNGTDPQQQSNAFLDFYKKSLAESSNITSSS